MCNDLAISLAAFRAIAKADNDQRFDKPAHDSVWMLGKKLNVGKEKVRSVCDLIHVWNRIS